MHLIDNINLEASVSRLVPDVFDDLTNFIDTPIGGPINFQNIDRAALGDLLALGAFIARLGSRSPFAVERFGQDPGRRSFAHAAHAGKEIRVRDTVRADGILQSAGYVLLPGDIGKILRAPFPRDDQVRHKLKAGWNRSTAQPRCSLDSFRAAHC